VSETWYRLEYGDRIVPVEVLKVTEHSVTFHSRFWNTPQRSMSRNEFFKTPEEAFEKMLERARERVDMSKRQLEGAESHLAGLLKKGMQVEKLEEIKS
jgi:hypothetical protein